MIANTPRALPPLSAMLFDLANPTPAQVGRALGVSPRTVRRWIHADHAPRPAMLALFWLTRWGRSQVDCAAVNDATASRGLAEALSAQNKALQRQLRTLEGLQGAHPQAQQPGDMRWPWKSADIHYAPICAS